MTMLRLAFTVVCGLIVSISYGQLKKFYSLKEMTGFDTVAFKLEATAGNCLIGPSSEPGSLNIFGNTDLETINPSFKARIENNTCKVSLSLEEFKSSSIQDGLMFAMLRSGHYEHNFWKIQFNPEKTYKLDLNYGFGNADIDLSSLPVKRLTIKSGSADVVVDYQTGERNPIQMDTFLVKVDMGTLVANRLDMAQANCVIANVGFGKALLDLSDAGANKCTINATVGAGNLEIFIPEKKIPMIIYLKDSPLCGFSIVPGFEEVESGVYVNMGYSAKAPNLLTFNVDVALGNVAFSYAR